MIVTQVCDTGVCGCVWVCGGVCELFPDHIISILRVTHSYREPGHSIKKKGWCKSEEETPHELGIFMSLLTTWLCPMLTK